MFSAEVRVGRLLEVRLASPLPLYEAQALVHAIRRLVKATHAPSIGLIDLRGVRILDPDVVDFLAELMRKDNPFLARNAFLVPDGGALQALQIERLLKSGGSVARKAFRVRADAEAWLAETLDTAEKARLAAFLDELA